MHKTSVISVMGYVVTKCIGQVGTVVYELFLLFV